MHSQGLHAQRPNAGKVQDGVAEQPVRLGRPAIEHVLQVMQQNALAEPGEGASFATEDVHRDRPSAVEGSDEPVRGHKDVVERHLGQLIVAVRLGDAAHLDAG